MSRRATGRTRLRVLGTLAFLGLLAAITLQAARGLASALERPVLYRYFDEALARLPEPLSAVDWQQAPVLDRPLQRADQATVARRLTEAWAAHASALATGNAAYLPDQFSGTALIRATQAATVPGANMVVLHQRATPVFFHRDGSLLQVTSEALTARFLLKQGALAGYRLTTDRTVTTLMNEAAGWRVFGHMREAATPVAPARTPYPHDKRLAGVNYYPADTPWALFWPQFDRAVIAADMARIRDLGGNALRIFLQRDAFLDPDAAPRNLENLRALLVEADRAGLQVVPTLFDLRGGYEPGLWANDLLWLRAVLPVLQAAPNIAYVDLKNEPDLDYAAHGRGLVQAWLMTMAAAARQMAPGLPLTIGWSRADTATDLVDQVDLVSYHDYQPPEGAADRLAMLRRAAGGKPVHLTETGASSWSMALGVLPHSPRSQAAVLEDRLTGLSDLGGLFLWTLHDFPEPDARAVGRSPWRKGLQSSFGLIGGDGREKPAAAVARRAFQSILKGSTQ
jgi:hypothetical protein